MSISYLKQLEEELIDDGDIEHVSESEVMIYCPYCNHHKMKLAVNTITGFWQCFVCSETGGFRKLEIKLNSEQFSSRETKSMVQQSKPKKELTETFQIHEKGLSYLISRGITNDKVLTETGPCFNQGSMLFPYRDVETGKVVGYKARSINEPKTKYSLLGQHPGLYTIDLNRFLNGSTTDCIIVEGEIDCLSVYQYLYESGGNMADICCIASTGITNRNCIPYMAQFDTVYVWFDNDKDKKVRKIVDKSKKQFLNELSSTQEGVNIRIISAPDRVKDANEYLTMGYDLEGFKGLLRDSEPYLEGQVHRKADFYLNDMNEYLEDEVRTMGTPTLFDSVDEMLGGGKRLGELTALQAEAKTGKNTIYHCMMYRWLEAGIPIGYASRELSPDEEVLPNLLSLKYKMNFWKAKKNNLLTPDLVQTCNKTVKDWPLYFAHGYGVIDIDDIIKWVIELSRLGVQFFFIDHMHYCLHDPENSKEISSFIRALKTLCKEKNIHIDIIIQPKYLQEGQKLGLSSLRGGSAIGQAIDNLFILKRHNGVEGYEDSLSELKLEVARHKLAQRGKKVYFQYDKETTHIQPVNITKDVRSESKNSSDITPVSLTKQEEKEDNQATSGNCNKGKNDFSIK